MELDLFDAIRLRRVIEFDVDGVRYAVEPHRLRDLGGRDSLQAFVIRGPIFGKGRVSELDQSSNYAGILRS